MPTNAELMKAVVRIRKRVSGSDFEFADEQVYICLVNPIVYFNINTYESMKRDKLSDKDKDTITILAYGIKYMNPNMENKKIELYIKQMYYCDISLEDVSQMDAFEAININASSFLNRKYIVFNPKYLEQLTELDMKILHSKCRSKAIVKSYEFMTLIASDELNSSFPLLKQTPKNVAITIRESIDASLDAERLNSLGKLETTIKNVRKVIGHKLKADNLALDRMARNKTESRLMQQYLSSDDKFSSRELSDRLNIPKKIALKLNKLKDDSNKIQQQTD